MTGTISGKEAETLRREWEQQQREARAFAETQRAFEHIPPMQQFGHGVIRSGDKLWLGAKDLFTDLSDEEKVRLAEYEAMKTFPATAGSLTTDAALLALPGGAASGATRAALAGAKALPRAVKALLPVAAESAVVGGYEGLKAPDAGDTRLGNAATAGLTNMGLGTVAPVVRGLTRARASEAAKKLLDKGVPLTPGMAYKGNMAAAVERRMADTPFLRVPTQRLQDKAVSEWNRSMFAEVSPPGRTVLEKGEEGFRQLQSAYKQAYNDVWTSLKPDNYRFAKAASAVPEINRKIQVLPTADAQQAKALFDHAKDSLIKFGQSGETRLLDELDDTLRKASSGNSMLDGAVGEIRNMVRNGLPKKTREALQVTDSQYAKFKVLENAAYRVRSIENSHILPRDLVTGVKNKGTPGSVTRGDAAMYSQARQGSDTIARPMDDRSQINTSRDIAPWLIAGAMMTEPTIGTGLGIARSAVTEPMRRVLTGQLPPGFKQLPLDEKFLSAGLRAWRQGMSTAPNLPQEED